MTDQDKRNIAVVRAMYAGDEAERASIARDIVWHVPGHNPVSGDYHGYDEYTQLMVARMAPLDRWDFMLEDVMVNVDEPLLRANRLGLLKALFDQLNAVADISKLGV